MNNRGGLNRKLLVSHVGVALTAVLSILLLVNLVMSFSFHKYQNNQQKAEVQSIHDELIAAYDETTSEWSPNVWMLLSHQAMARNYIVRIYNNEHLLLWDTSQMGMQRQTSDFKNRQAAIQQTLVKNNHQLGTIEFQASTETFQNLNQQFLRMFNTLLWAALVIVIIGTYLFSRYIASSISQPLIRIKEIAAKMKEGDLTSRIEVANLNSEIREVGLALNHLAEGMEKQDQLRKTLTADVAHELRTPITTIQSHLEAFQDEIWEPTPDRLVVCHDQVLRLVQLINDLENLAAAENPMVHLKKEMVSLHGIVQQSLITVSGQFVHKNLSFNLVSESEVWITGDRVRLDQVFLNLLSNAFKYTNTGSIHIVVSKDSNEGIVTISDTGQGISEDELPYIFERFYRGDKSRNRKTGGAGIGLAIVKAILDAHAGSIQVQSELNTGTTVRVRLPIIR
ncbi:sensor histidine kinase [Paenibacillus sp. sgz500958]|uniref:sensor histidine kinase n=1 Tax=Paenibacillus sp. sgz500958 TaxID=3242475 RepID=UPI0036D4235F